MPKSSFGSGIGLSSDFRAADAMWLNDRNRKSAQKAAANAIDAKEREKASEYVTKYIDVNNSGINPLWAGKAKEESIKYLNNFYTGMKLDPNYARSAENIKAFQELSTNLDKWKIASENLGKTAQLAYAHPEDVEVDAQVNEAVNSGDYAKWEAIAKAKGIDPDTYSLGFGTLAKPNMAEHNKHVMNGVYGTTRPSMKEVKEGDFIAAYQVDNGNQEAYDANALRLYNSDPLAKNYFEAKGTGFEGYKALLEKPLPQSKFSNIVKKDKVSSGGGGGNSFGNKSGMVNVKSYTRGDGATIYEIKDNTASNDPKILEIPLLKGQGKGFGIRDPKVIEKDGKLFVEGTEMTITDSDDGTIASSFKPTTRKIVIEIPKDDLGVGIMNKLSNMYGNVSDAKLDNGEWVMGINENINLRNWDKGGVKKVEAKQTQGKAETQIPATPKISNTYNNYLKVLDSQYQSIGKNNPDAYKNSWSVRPKEIDKAYDEFAKKGEHRTGDALLTEEGYKAIDKFENTKGTAQGTSMNKGDGYSKTQEKEIRSYVENNIGLDIWKKMPEKLKTQVYSLAFNSVKDDRIIKGLAQALAPDKIKTDADRQNLTANEAKQIIKSSFGGSKDKKGTTAEDLAKKYGGTIRQQQEDPLGIRK